MAQDGKGPPRGDAASPIDLAFPGRNDHQDKTPNPAATQVTNLRAVRRQRMIEHLHRLGPSPLGHFIREVEVATGADVTARLERYSEIGP